MDSHRRSFDFIMEDVDKETIGIETCSVVFGCGTLWNIVELLGFRVLCLLSSIDSRDASAGENKFVRFATSCGTGSIHRASSIHRA